MSKFNEYSLPVLAILTSFAFLGIMIIEFQARSLTVVTGLMALAGVGVFSPLLKYVYHDLRLNSSGYLLVMYGVPLALFSYGLWVMVWLRMPDIGIVLILLSVGWIQYSIRKQLDERVVKKVA